MAGYRGGPEEGSKASRFVRSVLAGTAIAALIPFGFFLAMVLSSDLDQAGAFELLFIVALAIGIPLAIVLAASTFIGLPTTFLLRSVRRESAFAYTTVGALAGLGIVLAFFGIAASWLLPAGLIAGATTGYVWWRNRAVDGDA